ncbi:HotDog domain-containing protein [Aspergillus tamarii]|uniref:HotDog domain-containing protein n=1 Tax=Aspergillus tamarii TaxID=41984 RepID=A0A5N6UD77_ASPTM|nr:HotDog domain-containing protein [Aspergillus tamarii]
MNKQYNYEGYIQALMKISIPRPSEAFFTKSPCVKAYLSSGLYQPVPFTAQFPAPDRTANSFFGRTINTLDTIEHAMGLVHRATFGLKPHPTLLEAEIAKLDEEMRGDPPFILLVKAGGGLNGFEDTIHGGVLASLFDEALSCCAEQCRASFSDAKTALYTARLDVSYGAPVSSSCILIIKTWLRQRDDRKWFLDAELFTEDGKVRGTAKSLWISQKPQSGL